MNLFCRHLVEPACIVLVMAFVLTGCGGGGGSDTVDDGLHDPAPERQWTYMVYMAADNNLSSAADLDINEMESVGSGNDVNIVVQAEFSTIYNPDLAGHTLRGRITRDDDWDVISSNLADMGNLNMADPQTLTAFIDWAAQYYPAQHYALVLWSHSDGWKSLAYSSLIPKGMITDSSDPSSGMMSLPDLAGAVRSSAVNLKLINFDTCLMGMYEVACEFSGLAETITFSEELYPSYGDPYDDILQELTDNPGMDGFDLAQVITMECRGFYQYISETYGYDLAVTKSAIDMSDMDQLHAGLCALAEVMSDNMDSEGPNIVSARDASLNYNYVEHHDLGDFLEKLDDNTVNSSIEDAILQVQETMSELVISNEVYSSVPGDEILRSQGLAIYLPSSSQVYDDDLDDYSGLACNQSGSFTWGDFVAELVGYEDSP